jgi:thiol-disulfide isomerase/thioredoxin
MKAMCLTKVKLLFVALTGIALAVSWIGGNGQRLDAKRPQMVRASAPKQESVPPNQAKAPVQKPPAALGAIAAAEGYVWVDYPRKRDSFGPTSSAWLAPLGGPGIAGQYSGFAAITETDKDGGLVYTLSHSADADFRPVAFDAQGKRRDFERLTESSAVNISMVRYRLDPKVLPADKVAKLGVEAQVTEHDRQAAQAAKEAAARAKQQGIEAPPYPQVGKEFDFTLTTMDGKKIRAGDYRGKAVLIFSWATWCPDSMMLLPEINDLHKQWHEAGLEVIGINFDKDAKEVTKECKSLGASWPQVMAPTDEKTRSLWQQIMGTDTMLACRVLFVGPDGILQTNTLGDFVGAHEQMLKVVSENRKVKAK